MFLSPLVLVLVVVEVSKPYKSVADLIKFGKQNPGVLNYGSAGAGTGTHLTGELVQTKAGIKMTHVPYKGSAPALQDLLGARLDLMFDYPATTLPHNGMAKDKFKAFIADEMRKWAEVVRASGATLN